MIYLHAYFDESGKKDSHSITSFCGWLGTNDDWASVARPWDRTANRLGITDFKSAKLVRYNHPLSRQIDAIGVEGRIEALSPFMYMLREKMECGIAVAVDCEAYRSLSDMDRAILGKDPLHIAFLQAITLIDARLSDGFPNRGVQVCLTCDEEEHYSCDWLKMFIFIRRHYPKIHKRFISIAFADDKHYFQLQAADFLALIGRQEAERRFFNKPFALRGLYEAAISEDANKCPVFGAFVGAEAWTDLVEAEAKKKGGKYKISKRPNLSEI